MVIWVFFFFAQVSKAQCYELRAIVCMLVWEKKQCTSKLAKVLEQWPSVQHGQHGVCARGPVANVNAWYKGFRGVSAHTARHSRVSEGSGEQCVCV